MNIPAIIDCDPGHDDVMAILLGARTLDLKGITTVHGNAPLSLTTKNARVTVELAELTHIPIAAGMARPLIREASYGAHVHGKTGLDGPILPDPTVPILAEHAIDFLYRTATTTENLHLIPVGPLTNIAAALQRYPDLPQHIAEISLMGGSLMSGNRTAAAEFNIWADAEAAQVVFSSGIPIKMLGLNVTRQVNATPEYRKQIREMGSRTAVAVADMLDFYSERLALLYGLPGGSMHDPLAVTALVDPDVLSFEPMHVAIELTGTHTYGMTVCDYRNRRTDSGEPQGEPANAEVAVAVDADRFWERFLDVLQSYP
ncbi:MAG: nucleoside hydrolase [Chloroflexi bacterium]|nr:nucleoside hydrolase [Chloroflexota bacterium]